MAFKGKSVFKFIIEQPNVTLAINKIGNIDCALATIRGGLTSRLWTFCVYWDYAEWKIFSELDQNFFIFQISNDPLVFANKSFSKILYINSYRDGFISQNVKIYLAYTEYKPNQV
jgi:hypothetical protein